MLRNRSYRPCHRSRRPELVVSLPVVDQRLRPHREDPGRGWYAEGQPTVYLGPAGDIAVPGDYNGNVRTDGAIWRPSVGGWYVEGQPTVFLGLNGDVPLPQAVYRAFF